MKGYKFYYHRNTIPMEAVVFSKMIIDILLNYWNYRYNQNVYCTTKNDKYFNSIAKLETVDGRYEFNSGISYVKEGTI